MDANVLKAIGEPTRFKLLRLMSERSYCVQALAYESGISESAVSQHLKILRDAGLVEGIKRGFYTHYRVNRPVLEEVINEFRLLTEIAPKPCERPFYGCPLSEKIGCKSYVPPEKRGEHDD